MTVVTIMPSDPEDQTQFSKGSDFDKSCESKNVVNTIHTFGRSDDILNFVGCGGQLGTELSCHTLSSYISFRNVTAATAAVCGSHM